MRKQSLTGYFKKIKRAAALYLICTAIPPCVCFLYGISPEPLIYGAVLCCAAGLTAFGYGYYKYEMTNRSLRALKRNLPVGLENLPLDHDGNEALLGEILKEVNWQRMDALQQKNSIYEEFTDYYTLWAHQIKTPISAMRLLLQEEPDKNRDALSELFKIEEYVEMVLVYLRTEDISADMQFQNYELDVIVREQIHKFARIFIGKKIGLDYESVECSVLTDGKWLGFVIGQIISNALKYTKDGKIAIYMAEKEPKTLVIEDTGIGISEQDLPRVFEKGFTGYNGRADSHSTGIGLYLCAKIMKKLGHKVRIESESGKGTRVFLGLDRDELELIE